MARTLQDRDLLTWEAFASTGRFGYPDRSHIVFYCLTDLSRRPRYFEIDGDKAAAERQVEELPDGKLMQLLESSKVAD